MLLLLYSSIYTGLPPSQLLGSSTIPQICSSSQKLDYQESLSLVHIIFLEPSSSWLSGKAKLVVNGLSFHSMKNSGDITDLHVSLLYTDLCQMSSMHTFHAQMLKQSQSNTIQNPQPIGILTSYALKFNHRSTEILYITIMSL